MVGIGAPVGTPGKGPEEPAMSRWTYGRGVAESTPCFTKPEVTIIKEAGIWWPRGVRVEGALLH